jgi:hypothetical protein
MTNTYEWTIASMPAYPQYEGQTDVVFQVNWACVASDGTNNASLSGTTGVAYTAGEPYTPYNQLTQEQVLDWVWAVTPKSDTEAYLDGQLKSVELPLPWAPPEVNEETL